MKFQFLSILTTFCYYFSKNETSDDQINSLAKHI